MCAGPLRGQAGVSDVLELELMVSVSCPTWCWGPNWVRWEEQQVSLTWELSLPPLGFSSINFWELSNSNLHCYLVTSQV